LHALAHHAHHALEYKAMRDTTPKDDLSIAICQLIIDDSNDELSGWNLLIGELDLTSMLFRTALFAAIKN
jgi:hypothetical protein